MTGAAGFVGRVLVGRLRSEGREVLPIVRSPGGLAGERAVGAIDADTDWRDALQGVDAVVHLAARVHVMNDAADDPLPAYRSVNTEGSLNLARQAAEAGVRRFVFMSSVKVNGEKTEPGRPFRRGDPPAPSDPYGISKYEAELGLAELDRAGALETVIIRPPLVYGAGVGGNFRTMMNWVERGIPLPLGAIRENRRSFVGVDNLADLVALCLDHPAAAGKIYLVRDGRDVSTRELIDLIAKAMGRRSELFSLPPALLRAIASASGKRAAAERLIGSLQIDMEDTRRELGWVPPLALEEGLARTVAARRPGAPLS